MLSMKPLYISALETGELDRRIETCYRSMQSCILCPRLCKANRLQNETGICKTGIRAKISGYHPHFGEESPISGTKGSGTIFFAYCNLLCNFCQNYDTSHLGYGRYVSNEELAAIMLELQNEGCHNINFVSPSHVVYQILSAIKIAAKNGLNIPLIYNTGTYDEVASIKLFDGIIDIYMPDFKFWNNITAAKLCKAPDYPEKAKNAIIEMYKQVGDLQISQEGIATRGLLLRHLVLPGNLADTPEIMLFLAEHVSKGLYVNIMPQYRPSGTAFEIDELSRTISDKEYREAIETARSVGIHRFDLPLFFT